MKPVTISELSELLKNLVKNGHGDEIVSVPSDDECNDVHALWYCSASRGEDISFYNENTKERETRKSVVIG